MNDKAQHHFDAAQDFFWEAGRKLGEFLEALGAGLCETSSYLAESVGDLASFSVSCFELKNALDQEPAGQEKPKAAPQEEPAPSFTQGSLDDFVELDDSDLPF